MIYTKMTKKAMKIAFDAHKDQVDKKAKKRVEKYKSAIQMLDITTYVDDEDHV